MIGNYSFEENIRGFNRMYNFLKSVDASVDDITILDVITSKVMIEQELENIMYNLNIEDISTSPRIQDLETWVNNPELHGLE